MEHIETYRDRQFWAWTEPDGPVWKGCYVVDNGVLVIGVGGQHEVEQKVLDAVIEIARARLEAAPRT